MKSQIIKILDHCTVMKCLVTYPEPSDQFEDIGLSESWVNIVVLSSNKFSWKGSMDRIKTAWGFQSGKFIEKELEEGIDHRASSGTGNLFI